MFNFRSQITKKIFDYYFINKKARHYINELANILDVDTGNLFRKLKELEEEGIMKSESVGNQKFFFINKNYPLLSALEKTYNTKFGLAQKLKEKILKIKGIKSAYIFGSFANGNFSDESDLDILLIGNHSSLEAKRGLLPFQKVLKREINIIDLTEKELKNKIAHNDEFIQNIFSKAKIKLL